MVVSIKTMKLYVLLIASIIFTSFVYAGPLGYDYDTLPSLEAPARSTDGPGTNASGNESYFNTLYWRLDGVNAPPTASWDMGAQALVFTSANRWNLSSSGADLVLDSLMSGYWRQNVNTYIQQKNAAVTAFTIDEANAGSAVDLFTVIADGVQRFTVDNHGDFIARNGTMTNLTALKITTERLNVTSGILCNGPICYNISDLNITGATFSNTNIAYLNNTQTFSGINNFTNKVTFNNTAPIEYRFITCGKGEFITQAAGASGNYTLICQAFSATLNETHFALLNRTTTQSFAENITAPNLCYSDGTNCTVSGGGGNPFDQVLNRTSNVTHDVFNASRINAGGSYNTTVPFTARATATGNTGYSMRIENSTGGSVMLFSGNGKFCQDNSGGTCDNLANGIPYQQFSDTASGAIYSLATNTQLASPQFQFRISQGTHASPQPAGLFKRAFSINVLVYDGVGRQTSGTIIGRVDYPNETGVAPLGWVFQNGNSTVTVKENLIIDSQQQSWFNTTLSVKGIGHEDLDVLSVTGYQDTDNVVAYTGNLTKWGVYDAFSSGGGTPGTIPMLVVNRYGYLQPLEQTLQTCAGPLKNSIGANATGTYGCNGTAWIRLF